MAAPQFRRLYRLVVPPVSAILTLLVVELVLALFRPVPYSIEWNMYFEPDPFTGYRLKPHGKGFFQHGIPAEANRDGLRDTEVSLQKPAGTYRLLVLGDSFTVGANVMQAEAYPRILKDLLQRRLGRVVEVVNAGVGGWEPFQYAQYYEHYGRRFNPDAILVGFFVGNDAFNQYTSVDQTPTAVMGRRMSRQEASSPFIKLKVFAYAHSQIARLLSTKSYVAEDFTRKSCRDFTAQYIDLQRSRLGNHLKRSKRRYAEAQNAVFQLSRIKRLADEASIPLVIALIPDENQVNGELQKRLLASDSSAYDLDMPQSMLQELFRDRGIPSIDLLPWFRRDPRCLYMNDSHWTPEGHALAAAAICDSLVPFLDNR
jgi:hypothetical protein